VTRTRIWARGAHRRLTRRNRSANPAFAFRTCDHFLHGSRARPPAAPAAGGPACARAQAQQMIVPNWRDLAASTSAQQWIRGYCPAPGRQSCPAPPRLGRPAPGNCPRAGQPRTRRRQLGAATHTGMVTAGCIDAGDRPPRGPRSCHRARSPVKGATAFGLRVAARWRKRHPGPPTFHVESRHLSGGREQCAGTVPQTCHTDGRKRDLAVTHAQAICTPELHIRW
jgi:hypothetical protein